MTVRAGERDHGLASEQPLRQEGLGGVLGLGPLDANALEPPALEQRLEQNAFRAVDPRDFATPRC